jgi:hypothetical protein
MVKRLHTLKKRALTEIRFWCLMVWEACYYVHKYIHYAGDRLVSQCNMAEAASCQGTNQLHD